MTDLSRDELTLSRIAQATLSPQRGLAEMGRRPPQASRSVSAPAVDRVSVSPQARLRAAAPAESRAVRVQPVAHNQPRVSMERLERIKRFYAAGNMRPNPQAIARHLWHERHGL